MYLARPLPVVSIMAANLGTLEDLLSRAYSLYLLLLKADDVPGNTDELRDVLFTFCNDLSMEVIGV